MDELLIGDEVLELVRETLPLFFNSLFLVLYEQLKVLDLLEHLQVILGLAVLGGE